MHEVGQGVIQTHFLVQVQVLHRRAQMLTRKMDTCHVALLNRSLKLQEGEAGLHAGLARVLETLRQRRA